MLPWLVRRRLWPIVGYPFALRVTCLGQVVWLSSSWQVRWIIRRLKPPLPMVVLKLAVWSRYCKAALVFDTLSTCSWYIVAQPSDACLHDERIYCLITIWDWVVVIQVGCECMLELRSINISQCFTSYVACWITVSKVPNSRMSWIVVLEGARVG